MASVQSGKTEPKLTTKSTWKAYEYEGQHLVPYKIYDYEVYADTREELIQKLVKGEAENSYRTRHLYESRGWRWDPSTSGIILLESIDVVLDKG